MSSSDGRHREDEHRGQPHREDYEKGAAELRELAGCGRVERRTAELHRDRRHRRCRCPCKEEGDEDDAAEQLDVG